MATIRPFEDADVEAWVAIRNQHLPEPITPAMFRDVLSRPAPFERRLVAESGGAVVGIASLIDTQVFRPWLMVQVQVSVTERGRGLGDRLLAALTTERPAAAGMQGDVRDDDPGSRAWAEARGFEEVDHRIQSRLDLTGWRPPEGLAPIEVVETEDWDLVYDLFARLFRDVPDEAAVPDRHWFDANLMGKSHAFLAQIEGRTVGLALLELMGDGLANHPLTGVLREARGKGVALALKAAVIERAQERGIQRVITANNARNAPMLAVNNRLGYVRLVGIWLMRRPF